MGTSIEINDKDFIRKITDLAKRVMPNALQQGVHDVASEILRLSGREVPHDKGLLQNSGNVEDQKEESIVGYNKVYAARLHEHPEYRFQKGRKGKYLEDPIKNNLSVFIKYIQDSVGGILR